MKKFAVAAALLVAAALPTARAQDAGPGAFTQGLRQALKCDPVVDVAPTFSQVLTFDATTGKAMWAAAAGGGAGYDGGSVGTPFKAPNGTQALPAYSWTSEPSSGLYRAGSKDFFLSVFDGAGRFEFQGAGIGGNASIFTVGYDTSHSGQVQIYTNGDDGAGLRLLGSLCNISFVNDAKLMWSDCSIQRTATTTLDVVGTIKPNASATYDLGASGAIWQVGYFGSLALSTPLTYANGGTGQSVYARGDIVYASAANVLSKLTVGTSGKVLRSDGTDPSWQTLVAGDIPALPASQITSGQLAQARGGTGLDTSAVTDGQLLIGNTTGNAWARATLAGTANQVVVTNGASSITLSTPQSIGTGSSPTFAGLTLTAALTPGNGGTGLVSYAVGDLLYASGSTTIAKLADVATGQVLVSGGVATAPSYTATPTLTSLTLGATGSLAFSTDVFKSRRGAAGTEGLSNGTNATHSRVYNTTDSDTGAGTNTEYLDLGWSSNLCTIQTAKTGSGTQRNLTLSASSTGTINLTATNLFPTTDGTVILGDGAHRYASIYTVGTCNANSFRMQAGGTGSFTTFNGGINIGSTFEFRFTTGDPDAVGADIVMSRRAAQSVGLSDGTSPASFRVYNTTDAASGAGTNTEYLGITWASNICTLGTVKTGSGTQRGLNLDSGSGNSATWTAASVTHSTLCIAPTFATAGSGLIMGGSGVISTYKGVSTAGWGVPAIYATGNFTAQTAAKATVATYTCGAADGAFEVSGSVLVTASTTHSFSLNVDYTDESNTARTLVMPVAQLAGTFVASGLITNVTGAGPYESPAMHIRCKASTAITISTSSGGTYTSVTYNVNGTIRQIN